METPFSKGDHRSGASDSDQPFYGSIGQRLRLVRGPFPSSAAVSRAGGGRPLFPGTEAVVNLSTALPLWSSIARGTRQGYGYLDMAFFKGIKLFKQERSPDFFSIKFLRSFPVSTFPNSKHPNQQLFRYTLHHERGKGP